MNPNEFTLRIPMPNAWISDGGSNNFATVTLKINDGKSFAKKSIGGVLDKDGFTLPSQTVQWRVELAAGHLKATVTLTLPESSVATSHETEFRLTRPLQIDIAETKNNENPQYLLIRGSVCLPLNGTLNADFKRALIPLWPIEEEIKALRLEPAGLYLESWLPAAIFPPATPRDKAKTKVVLRVPQHEKEIKDINESREPFWTLEAFDFGDGLPTSGGFLRDYAQAIAGFGENGRRSFVDNVVASPDANSIVRIYKRDDNTLEWVMPDLRDQFRVQIGGGEAGEAAFFPEEIRGKVQRKNGLWQRIPFADDSSVKHHLLVRRMAAPEEYASTVSLDVSLGASNEKTAKLELTGQKLSPLSLPTIPLNPAGRGGNQPESWMDRKGDQPEIKLGRSWLCTDQGWLAIDGTIPNSNSARERHSAGAIRGVLELEKIAAYLMQPAEQSEVAAGGESQPPLKDTVASVGYGRTQLDALQVQLTTLSKTAVILGINFDNRDDVEHVSSVKLFLGNPLTTIITPGVWYMTSSSGESSAQIATTELLPTLSVDKDGYLLPNLLQKASFISNSPAFSPSDSDIQAEIVWAEDPSAPRFGLKLQAAQLRLWHPIPDLPLAQTFSRTLAPAHNHILDPNRGLLPFKPTNVDKPITIFNFGDLPAVDLPLVENAPKSRQDLGGWKIVATQLPTRYFLPTLPGVEATLPVSSDAGLHWVYRHAVPVLDEAYAEVVEDPQDSNPTQIQGGLDFTRVAGAEAFEIKSGEGEAFGWARKSKSNKDGHTKINITEFKPDGRHPKLSLHVPYSNPSLPTTFDRTENTAGLTSAELEITNNGQRLGVENGVTQDGEGLETHEIVGDETTIRRLAETVPLTLITGTYASASGRTSEDFLTLELMGIPLGEFDPAADLSGQRWMLHDGSGNWPVWLGMPLFPLRLTQLTRNENSQLIAVIEAVILPYKPSDSQTRTGQTGSIVELENNPPDGSDGAKRFAPVYAGGRVKLVFNLEELSVDIKPTEGQDGFDWQFSPSLEHDQALLRLRGNYIQKNLFKLSALTLKHPLGVIDFGNIQDVIINYNNEALPYVSSLSPATPVGSFWEFSETFHYVVILDRQTPSYIKAIRFGWQYEYGKNTRISLEYSTITNSPSPWFLTICRKQHDNAYQPVVGPLQLEKPQTGDRNRFLFKIAQKDAVDSGIQQTAWLKPEMVTGIVGVGFSIDRKKIESITADIQVSLVDRYPNDAVLLWDPVRQALHTMDRNVGRVSKKFAIGGVGQRITRQSTVENDEIFWVDDLGQLRRWRLGDENQVYNTTFAVT